MVILVKIAKANGGTIDGEEEADAICKQGHQLAMAIYQGLITKSISKEPASVRSCFRMPLDAQPYFNPKAVALPVSDKPMASQPEPEIPKIVEAPDDKNSAEISKDTQRLMDFLNSHYTFRYKTIMDYFNAKETLQILEWNKKFSVKTAADHYFFDYFDPAMEGEDGEWITASAIFEHLKKKVGVSLLKPSNVSSFGRMLSNISALKKRETKYGSEYYVRRKK